MNKEHYEKFLNFAKQTALKAGDIAIRERNSNTLIKNYKDNIELVTSADIEINKYITEKIKENFPSHKMLSEEMYNEPSYDDIMNNYVWVIDPIDGTVNYANGHLNVAISIALAFKGQVIIGVVYSPFQNELFYASKNNGAYLNNKPIKTAENLMLENALIGTGFSYRKKDRIKQVELLGKILQHCQDIRRLGAAALDLCYVANGRLGGYYESVKSWDMAAGALIAKEAGAIVGHLSDIQDNITPDLCGEGLVAAVPCIYNDLIKILHK